jgi:hypothetical protein
MDGQNLRIKATHFSGIRKNTSQQSEVTYPSTQKVANARKVHVKQNNVVVNKRDKPVVQGADV